MTYGVERLLNSGWLGFTTNAASVVGLQRVQLVPISDRLFRQKDQSMATLALLPDSDGKTLIQFGMMTYKKVSGWRVWGEVVGVVAGLGMMLGSLLRMLIWAGRKLLGKADNGGPLSLRLMPALSTLFFGAFWALFFFNAQNLEALGTCSVVSVTIMLSSIAFALSAAASLYLIFRHRRTPMKRMVYWRLAAAAVAVSTAAAYMGYWGLIGLRVWA